MTRNPYAHPQVEPAELEGPTRLSSLALASAALGLICCLPGVGIVGSVLGVLGIVRIGQSEGRLAGRGLAFTGLILGVLGTVIWLSLFLGLMQTLSALSPFGKVVGDIQSGNLGAARGMLAPSLAGLSDDDFHRFSAAVDAEVGTFQRMPQGLAEWVSDYSTVADLAPTGRLQTPTRVTIPFPAHFSRGRAMIVIEADRTTLGSSGAAAVTGIEVRTLGGTTVRLEPAGPVLSPSSSHSTPPAETPGEAPPVPATPTQEPTNPPEG